MQKDKTPLPPFSSSLPFEEIDGVRFTKREIEIISCILAGRAQKIIASFLLIAPRTVETHTRNIMLKLECNSREGIINFIEKSGKSSLLRNYYQALLIRVDFEKRLRSIAILTKGKSLVCKLVYAQEKDNNFPLIQKMEEHLKLAGVTTKLEARQRLEPTLDLMYDSASGVGDYVIYITSKELIEEFCKEKKNSKRLKSLQPHTQAVFVFLSLEERNLPDIFKQADDINIVCFGLSQSYYLSFFILFKKIFSDPYLDQIITEFKQNLASIYDEFDKASFPITLDTNKISLKERFYSKKLASVIAHKRQYPFFANLLTIVASTLTIIVLIYSSFTFKGKQDSPIQVGQISQKGLIKTRQTIRSDFIIPIKSVLLNRPELLVQIDTQLKEKDGIRTIALVGPGGAGKTTLARQYAHSQKLPVVWEINAETKGSLLDSFESLAYALCQTEEEMKRLKELQLIPKSSEKETKIVFFVRERLKLHHNWCLVFDNVEKFSDVQKYFPMDKDTWGKGTVIITTRDSTIENNKHINHVIKVGELNAEQKFNLFTKIMGIGEAQSLDSTKLFEIRKFLTEIPSFPLDVSIAGYYLKATEISYSNYLDNLKKNNKDFTDIQQEILKESGDYFKTRYSIITLALQRLIEAHKDFEALLLFISLLDSQNIPKDLLNKYKNEVIVDSFIYHLKKYSLVEESTLYAVPAISIHRSTQAISLNYLQHSLNLPQNDQIIKMISYALDSYLANAIDEDDLLKMKNHCEAFLSHSHLLTNVAQGTARAALGAIYFYLGNYKKTREYLEKNVTINNVTDKTLQSINARSLGYLGTTYRILGDYGKAKSSLEKSLIIYRTYFPENYVKVAWILSQIGIVYRDLGDYEKAQEFIKQGLTLYSRHLPAGHTKIAWSLATLATVYMEQGEYKEAQKLLEQSLLTYRKSYPDNHIRVAWLVAHMGIVYHELGDHKKAQELLEKSLIVYQKYFFDNHIELVRALRHLGNVYIDLGDYERGKTCLKRSIAICEKEYDKDHIDIGLGLISLANIYKVEGKTDLADELIERASLLLHKNNHPALYLALEKQGDIYLKRAENAKKNGNSEQAIILTKQGLDYIQKALKVVETHYPKQSVYSLRIHSKLSKLNLSLKD